MCNHTEHIKINAVSKYVLCGKNHLVAPEARWQLGAMVGLYHEGLRVLRMLPRENFVRRIKGELNEAAHLLNDRVRQAGWRGEGGAGEGWGRSANGREGAAHFSSVWSHIGIWAT